MSSHRALATGLAMNVDRDERSATSVGPPCRVLGACGCARSLGPVSDMYARSVAECCEQARIRVLPGPTRFDFDNEVSGV